jgi:predicted porin
MTFHGARLAALLGTCVALAAPGTVLAQSSVTLTGLIDASVGSSRAPGSDDTVYNVDSGKMTTSWIGFRGSEDLGGGLSAVFTIDSFLRVDNGAAGRFDGDAFWARNAWVGLASKNLGRVTVGRNTTSLFVATLLFNAIGDSFGYSPSIRHYFTSGTVSGDTGWSDSLQYSSPNWGGFNVVLTGAAGEGNGGRNAAATANYFGGPLGLTLSWQAAKKGAAVADTKTWQLGGAYDFTVVKLFGQTGKVENETSGNEYKIHGLGASMPIGAGKLLAQYGMIKPQTGAERKTFTIGYDHYVSKRTDLYVVAMNDKVEDLSAGKYWSVGVRHRF